MARQLELFFNTVSAMNQLALNRRQNAANILLDATTINETVGYLLPDGEWRFARWLGFIERGEARALAGAQPVRLVEITRIGRTDGVSTKWQEVPAGEYVHGCLVEQGAFAVFDAVICRVGEPLRAKSFS